MNRINKFIKDLSLEDKLKIYQRYAYEETLPMPFLMEDFETYTCGYDDKESIVTDNFKYNDDCFYANPTGTLMSYSLSKAISKFVDGKELTDWLYDFCETKDNDEIIEYVENYIL